MKKLVTAVSVVMLISTGVIADTAPVPTKAVLASEARADNTSLLLVAGDVVLGGITLTAGETNN